MNEVLIDELSTYAERLCRADDNIFGYGIWSHHIQPMIEISKKLAQTFGADQEIVIIALASEPAKSLLQARFIGSGNVANRQPLGASFRGFGFNRRHPWRRRRYYWRKND